MEHRLFAAGCVLPAGDDHHHLGNTQWVPQHSGLRRGGAVSSRA
jgi:hypothetical protein